MPTLQELIEQWDEECELNAMAEIENLVAQINESDQRIQDRITVFFEELSAVQAPQFSLLVERVRCYQTLSGRVLESRWLPEPLDLGWCGIMRRPVWTDSQEEESLRLRFNPCNEYKDTPKRTATKARPAWMSFIERLRRKPDRMIFEYNHGWVAGYRLKTGAEILIDKQLAVVGTSIRLQPTP